MGIVAWAAGVAATAAVVITESTRTPEGFRLRWNSAGGMVYAVEAAQSVGGPWSARIEGLAGEPAVSWIDAVAADPGQMRFYRVVEKPGAVDPGADVWVQRADAVPFQVASLVVGHLETCASAIYAASSWRGVIATNGTLREAAGNWTFDPSPADLLAVRYASGTNVAFRVRTLAGNFSGSVSTFLGSGHEFAFAVVQDGAPDLRIESRRPNGSCSIIPVVTAAGGIRYSNVTYTVDLRNTGPYCFEIDASGFSLLEDYRMTGTVEAPGFHLEVDHRRRYEQVGSGPDSASTEQAWIGHRMVVGADTYTWQGVTRRKSFRGGKISDWRPPGYWHAEGMVLRNGLPFGTYEYVPGTEAPFGFLRFIIRLEGRVIELERWI